MITRISVGPFFIRSDQLSVLKSRKTKISGIYRIINAHNGKSYVGSTGDLYHRLISHGSLLLAGKHSNKYLQNSFNKYGPGMFAFFVDELCTKSKLLAKENEYISLFRTMNRDYGYNLQMGIRDDTVGRWSDEVRSKIADSNRRTYANRPESCKRNSERLVAWHIANPGVAGGPRVIKSVKNDSLGLRFTGSAMDMKRKYPAMQLRQPCLQRLFSGKAKSYKGWTLC